ncbi:MAG: ferric reductase-like transmembrane domain-containing protein [Baekduia sp.]
MTTNELLWYLSRGSGLAAILVLTIVLVIGTWGPVRRQERRRGRGSMTGPVLAEVHRILALGTICFVAAHVLTAIVETYVDIDWAALMIPFSSGYEPFSVGLGTLSLNLALAVVATALLRKRLPSGWWRVVHKAAYALWPLAGIHALLLSGEEPAFVRWTIAACVGLGTFAIARRVMSAGEPGARPAAAARQPTRDPAPTASVTPLPPPGGRLWSSS